MTLNKPPPLISVSFVVQEKEIRPPPSLSPFPKNMKLKIKPKALPHVKHRIPPTHSDCL